MPFRKNLVDPLGNEMIFQNIFLLSKNCRTYPEIKKIITDPTFIIQIAKERICFFKQLVGGSNVMVEAKAKDSFFIVESCVEGPTKEYISELLSQGVLHVYI